MTLENGVGGHMTIYLCKDAAVGGMLPQKYFQKQGRMCSGMCSGTASLTLFGLQLANTV